MTLTKDDLQAISQLLDEKLEEKLEAKFDERLAPIENRLKHIEEDLIENNILPRLKRIEVDLIENNIIPRLNTIEACYLDTSARYIEYTDRMETSFQDIEVLKQVVAEHSEKLQKIS